ncbi:uncharacterized protein TNCV_1074281 [Trichonephila clavipes]|uniref:Uncharacterized protein n=1 Tax=Trichonephila clavipes TaxID=2585209 RepID=A0A8X6VQF7_TRICX|nr:uncharacterized protein TNCV_1074281 [Trichonephila clavipes]
MYHDKIPKRCKLNFTGIVDDALRIAGELFPKQTLKKYIRKEVEIDTDGLVRSRRFEKKKEKSLKATRGLLATDHVILNHGQVTWTTPELAPPLLTTTPHQREDVSALDRFNVHRCPTRWNFSGTGIELVTRQATIRYLYHSATAAKILIYVDLSQSQTTSEAMHELK